MAESSTKRRPDGASPAGSPQPWTVRWLTIWSRPGRGRSGPKVTWGIGAVIVIVALIGAVVTADPGGWAHHRSTMVTLRSSSGVVLATSATGPVVGSPTPAHDVAPARVIPAAAAAPRISLPALPRPTANLPAVAGLATTREADAVVTLPTTITASEVTKLVHLQGLSALEEIDTGTVNLAGAPAVTIGVDPGTFRQFTPKVTATQDELWRYIAGGALISSYEMATDRQLPLGQDLTVQPAGSGLPSTRGWLGGMASFGMPGVDLVVSHAFSSRLGLVPDSGLVVSASGMDPYALSAALQSIIPGSDVELLHPDQTTGGATTPALPSGTIGTALKAALTRVGDPYVWGGAGPTQFDCSGLVQWSFDQAGVHLPRTAAEQYLMGPRIPLTDARAGDLLFWAYDPTDPTFVDHVAMYLGHNMMVVAPYTGENVQVAPVPTADFAGAVRVDPAGATSTGNGGAAASS